MTPFRTLQERWQALRQSPLVRRVLRNASWSSFEYLAQPLMMLLSTPFLLSRLGASMYGVWMMVNTVIAMSGLAGLGLGDATIKFVSHHRARQDRDAVARVVGATLAINAGLGILTALAVQRIAPFLVYRFFKVDDALLPSALMAMRFGGLLMAILMVDSVLAATLRGLERYDLNARLATGGRALTLLICVALAARGAGVEAMVATTCAATALVAVLRALLVRRLVPGLRLGPSLDREVLSEVLGFGVWSWFQTLAGLLFQNIDRVLIASLLGAAPLAYYTVCLQVGQQVHGLLAAASSTLFPMTSALVGAGELQNLRVLYSRAMRSIVTLAAACWIPLYLLSSWLLTVWMGAEFSTRAAPTLRLLALAYGGLAALTIVPYYLLHGTGHIRLNVVFGILSGLLVAGVMILALPAMGLPGAGFAYLVNLVQVCLALMVTDAIVFKVSLAQGSWPYVLAYLLPAAGVVALERALHLTAWPIGPLFGVTILVGSLFVWISYRIAGRTFGDPMPGARVS